jgi:5-methylcytosine-specific restriction protein A
MARREFSTKIRIAAMGRCKGYCENCGAFLRTGRFAFDHVNPDGLTGEPTLENCMVLCNPCHDDKTRLDTHVIAKAKRREALHLGVKKPTRNPLPGSKASKYKKKMDGSVVLRKGYTDD